MPLNVLAGNAEGVYLAGVPNAAVIFMRAGTPLSGELRLDIPQAETRVVLTDLLPNTNYSVGVATAGGRHTVSVIVGSGLRSSAAGALALSVSSAGIVSGG